MAKMLANNSSQPVTKSHLTPGANMAKGFVLFGSWHKCPGCGSNVLFLDPAFKPDDDFLCGICVKVTQFKQ